MPAQETEAQPLDHVEDGVEPRHRVPRLRQHPRAVEDAAQEGERREHEGRDDVELLELVAPDRHRQPDGGERRRDERHVDQHPERVSHREAGEETGDQPDQAAGQEPAQDRRGQEGGQQVGDAQWRDQEIDDGPLQLGDEHRRRRVEERVLRERQQDQAGDDEADVGDAVDLAHPPAERVAEHQEVERRRHHRLRQRLPGHLEKPARLLGEQRTEADAVHDDRLGEAGDVGPLGELQEHVFQRRLDDLHVDHRRGERAGQRQQLTDGRAVDRADHRFAFAVERRPAQAQRLGERGDPPRPGRRQPEADLLAPELAHQRRRRVEPDQRPLVDDRHPIGQRLRLFEVVRGEHDGGPRGAQRADVGPQIVPQRHVDAGGRLVEERHTRPVDQRLGDQQPALHAAREGAGVGVRLG